MMVVIVKGVRVPDSSRERMVRAAVELFQKRGYAATSFNDVIEHSGAPRGSIYHHFPRGKEQLAQEAVRWYAERVARRLESAVAAASATEAVELFVTGARDGLVASGFMAGCAVAGVALDVGPGEDALRSSVAEAFERWRQILAEVFRRRGATPAQARRLSRFVVAAVEGALILSRADRTVQPLDDVGVELRAHLRVALGGQ